MTAILKASGFRPVPLHNEVFPCCCKARPHAELFSSGDAKLGGKTAQTTSSQTTARHQGPNTQNPQHTSVVVKLTHTTD